MQPQSANIQQLCCCVDMTKPDRTGMRMNEMEKKSLSKYFVDVI